MLASAWRLLRRQARSCGTGIALGALAGCIPHAAERLDAWAATQGWQRLHLQGGEFRLRALLLLSRAGPVTDLRVYIEGDGAAWANAYRPPRDPTPNHPLVLRLAEQDPAPAVAYLARPCQYLGAAELAGCSAAYWSDRRYAAEVVDALNQALDQLKARSGATHLRLVGYSGGGVLATLLAQRRADVAELITLAAPLALDDWTTSLGLSKLAGSLDPLRQPASRPLPPSLHFAGERDRSVPPAIPARFVAAHGGRLERLAGFEHRCCWARDWPQLLQHAPGAEDRP